MINSLKVSIILLFVCVFSSTANTQVIGDIIGHSGNYYDEQTFAKAFNEGATGANSISLPLGNGAELKTLDSYQKINLQGTVSAHQFNINGWEDGTAFDNEINVYTVPGMIANYGNHYEFLVQFPDVPRTHVDRIETIIEKTRNKLMDVGNDVAVTFPRTDTGQLTVHAAYTYNERTSTSRLSKDIEQLLLGTRAMLNDFLVARVKAKREYTEELRKSTPANLEKDDFYEVVGELIGWDLAKWDMPSQDTEHGYGTFKFNEQDIHYWNFRDSFYLGVAGYYSSSISDAQRIGISQAWLQWGQQELDNKEYLVEITPYYSDQWGPEWGHFDILSVKYPLDGTLTGKDIRDSFEDFIEDFAPNGGKAFDKLHNSIN